MAYLNNILIYSKNLEDYKGHIVKVLKRLVQANLIIKPKKSKFYKNTIKYLSFIISKKGIEIEDLKVIAIKSQPKLKYIKDLQAFLRFTNYYR